MENKNVLHPVKNSYYSLDYISGGCSHILWAVGWWSTLGRWGVGGGGVGNSGFQVTGMIKGYELLSKDFLGFEIFDFGVAWFKHVFI